MKKRKILVVLMTMMLLFSMLPTSASAAVKQPAGEEYLEFLEMTYKIYIKDRSKYCDDVWADIQQVYKEGREYGLEEDDYGLETCCVVLEYLGRLTWVKSYADLQEVKTRYLNEINAEYKNHKKADYNDYNWDYIQDGLYVGKKQINQAKNFAEASQGYYEAMNAMEWATTKEEVKMIKAMYKDELSRVVNLYVDAKEFSTPVWAEIQSVYQEAIEKMNKAEQENELESLYEEYLEKLCAMTKLTYPLEYEAVEKIMQEMLKPLSVFLEEMTLGDYITERIWEAEDILWEAEEDIYEAKNRDTVNKVVAKALEKMKALPTREYDETLYKEYILKVKAVGYTGSSIKVTWNANKDLDGYIVYRASSKNGAYKEMKCFSSGKTKSFVDKKTTYGKTYYYKVKGIKSIDFVDKYTKLSKASAGTPKLVKPTFEVKKVGSQDIKITWKRVTGADGYQIYRSNSINGQFKLVKTIKKGDTLTWRDTSTVKGKQYCYKVRAYDIKKDKTKKYSAYSIIKSMKR